VVPRVSGPGDPVIGLHPRRVLRRPGLSKGLRVPASHVEESGPEAGVTGRSRIIAAAISRPSNNHVASEPEHLNVA
jgi:hypothetical protein